MIEHADFEILDQRYVQKDDCNDIRKDVDRKIDGVDKAVAVLVNKVDMLVKILAAVAVPILAIAIKLLFGG